MINIPWEHSIITLSQNDQNLDFSSPFCSDLFPFGNLPPANFQNYISNPTHTLQKPPVSQPPVVNSKFILKE